MLRCATVVLRVQTMEDLVEVGQAGIAMRAMQEKMSRNFTLKHASLGQDYAGDCTRSNYTLRHTTYKCTGAGSILRRPAWVVARLSGRIHHMCLISNQVATDNERQHAEAPSPGRWRFI